MSQRDDDGMVKIVNVVSPAPREIWHEVLRADPLALETQSPAWSDALCATHGLRDASRLYETADGRQLVLPMLRRSLAGGLLRLEGSNPRYCGIGGVLAADGPSAEEIAAVFDDLDRGPALVRSVLPHPLLADEWAHVVPARATPTPRRAHLIDLGGGWDEVWATGFRSSTRSGIRRAERRGVRVRCGTGGQLVPEFHALLERAATRWARLQHEPRWLALQRLRYRDPLRKFQAIGRFLGERCRVWLATVDDRPAAAMMVIQGANAYDSRAAMDEDLRAYRANDLLLRHAIEDACRSGCRYYFMGESGWSESLSQFKERFGARPHIYEEYRFERLPISRTERRVKSVVKRAIGFRD